MLSIQYKKQPEGRDFPSALCKRAYSGEIPFHYMFPEAISVNSLGDVLSH